MIVDRAHRAHRLPVHQDLLRARARKRIPAPCSRIVNAPPYATSGYTKTYVDQMRELTKDLPELDADFSIVAIGGETKQAFAIWVLKDWSERTRSQKEIQQDLQARLSQGRRRAGLRLRAVDACPAPAAACRSRWSSRPPAIRARSTRWPSRSGRRRRPPASSSSSRTRSPSTRQQVTITVDRDRAAALNLPVRDIGTTLGLLVGGGSIAQFDRDSNSYDIIMQVPQKYRLEPGAARQLLHPQRDRRDGAAVGRGHGLDRGRAGGDRAVQPAQLGHHLGAAAARRHHRRRPRHHRGDRPAAPAGRLLHRLFRPVAARGRGGQHHRHRLRRSPSSSSTSCSRRSSRASATR